MLITVSILFALAACCAAVGLRGRKLDEHPYCRRCGYDLYGVYPGVSPCPECGADLHGCRWRGPVRHGRRKIRVAPLATGAMLFLLAFPVGGTLHWIKNNPAQWRQLKPDWLILREMRGAEASIDSAVHELVSRRDRGRLSPKSRAAFNERLLAIHADASGPWDPSWGDVIEAEWRASQLTVEQKAAYARHALQVSIQTRRQVVRGEPLPVELHLEKRVGSGRLLAVELELLELKLGAQELTPMFRAQGELTGLLSSGKTFILSPPDPNYPVPPDELLVVEEALGRTSMHALWSLRVVEVGNSPTGQGGLSFGTRRRPGEPPSRILPGPFLVDTTRTVTQQTIIERHAREDIELVTDPSLARAVRDAIYLQIVDDPGDRHRPAGRYAEFSVFEPPVPFAFDVVIRGSDGRTQQCVILPAHRDLNAPKLELDSAGEGPYDVTFIPNPALIRQSSGAKKMWGETVVLKSLPALPRPLGTIPPPRPAHLPEIYTVASLRLTDEDRYHFKRALRSIALAFPYAYAGSRDGQLIVYRVDEAYRNRFVAPLRRVETASDGSDLKIVGEALLLTRCGGLEVYSLANPELPEHIGSVLPEDPFVGHSIVLQEDFVYVLGDSRIAAYDLSQPLAPRYVATLQLDEHAWCGAVVGRHLVAGVRFPEGGGGIAIYEAANPPYLNRVGFLATSQWVFAVNATRDGRVAITMGPEDAMRGEKGRTAIVSLDDPSRPEIQVPVSHLGNRSAVVVRSHDAEFLVVDGGVFQIRDNQLAPIQDLFTGNFMLDAAVYHGDSAFPYVALAADYYGLVFKIVPPGIVPAGR